MFSSSKQTPKRDFLKTEPIILKEYKKHGIHKIYEAKKEPKEQKNPESKRNEKTWLVKSLKPYQFKFKFTDQDILNGALVGIVSDKESRELTYRILHTDEVTMKIDTIHFSDLEKIRGENNAILFEALENKNEEALSPFIPQILAITAKRGHTNLKFYDEEHFYREYLAGEFHRLMLCSEEINLQPKTRLFENKEGELKLMSSFIENFMSAADHTNLINDLEKKDQINQLGSLQIITWILADKDKHLNNWGIVNTGTVDLPVYTATTFDYGFALRDSAYDIGFKLTPESYEKFPYCPASSLDNFKMKRGFMLPNVTHDKVKITMQLLTLPDSFFKNFVESYIDDPERIAYYTNRFIQRKNSMLVAVEAKDYQAYILSDRSKQDLEKFISGLKNFKTRNKTPLFNKENEKLFIDAIWDNYNKSKEISKEYSTALTLGAKLIELTKKEQFEELNDLINSNIRIGKIINFKDEKGDTALLHAAKRGNLKIIDLLEKAGASLDAENIDAFESKLSFSIQKLAKKKDGDAILRVFTKYPRIALNDNEKDCDEVMRDTLVISFFENKRETAAEQYYPIAFIDALIISETGVSDFFDTDVMYRLLENKNKWLFEYVLEKILSDANQLNKLNLNQKCISVLIITMILNQKLDIVTNLIKYFGSVNIASSSDFDDQTPIFLAIAFGNYQLIELLLSAGARLDIQDKNGKLPLDMATDEIKAFVIATMLALYLKPKSPTNSLMSTQLKLIEDAKDKKDNNWVETLDNVMLLAKKYAEDQAKPGFFVSKDVPMMYLKCFDSKDKLFEALHRKRIESLDSFGELVRRSTVSSSKIG